MGTDPLSQLSRRHLLKTGSCGFGYLALADLAAQQAQAAAAYRNPLAPRASHFSPKAKRVIFMFMQGGPSQVDTFDHKPELIKADGKQNTIEYKGKKIGGKLLAPKFKFSRHGESGLPISDAFPNLARHADDLCLINSMHTPNAAHPQATIMLHTGSITFVRPSMGSWVVYGLGTDNENLPGFVTINPLNRLGGAQNYGSAFLPASFQGTKIGTGAQNIANIANKHLSAQEQRKHLDLVQAMNQDLLQRSYMNHEIEGVIQSFELAFRMQQAVPHVMNVKDEPQRVREMYGVNGGATANFGMQCLMARRLAEAGVRFIQINHNGWDQHKNLTSALGKNARSTDQPIAALITDLKQRGMFEDTLLVWGGEFGRTPQAQNNDGRRHNNRGYSMWMAGGGIKGGIRHGETDPTGGIASVDKVGIHDLHATILHLLGLNHEKLTYRYAGRDFRLTDVYGDVVDKIIA